MAAFQPSRSRPLLFALVETLVDAWCWRWTVAIDTAMALIVLTGKRNAEDGAQGRSLLLLKNPGLRAETPQLLDHDGSCKGGFACSASALHASGTNHDVRL